MGCGVTVIAMWVVLLAILVAGEDLAPEMRDGVSEADRRAIDQAIDQAMRNAPRTEATGADEPARYTFFPLSGIPGKDVFLSNAVDLDATSGIRDFDCTTFTYDGHRGHDMVVDSFRQQDIGVPVYAALDGTVVQTHDGEPDRLTAWDPANANRSNYVLLRHGGTHFTIYHHLRRGSVAVVAGQSVSAGTQLGLAASSGFSSWPHLHFESIHAGSAYEPFAGPCREGESYWTEQQPLQRAFYVVDFTFSPFPFDQYPNLAEDAAPRTGTYVQGDVIYFRSALRNVPAHTTYDIRLRRPDGTIAATNINSFNNPVSHRRLWTWRSFTLDSSLTGEWRIEIAYNGVPMIDAPFRVVAAASEIENRAPNPVSVTIKPPLVTPVDVPRCEVETSLVHEDPDYDVMAYRYQWTVGDQVVREVTSAELMDALPRGLVRAGDRLGCRVTPYDGALDGPSASAQVTVGERTRRRAVRH